MYGSLDVSRINRKVSYQTITDNILDYFFSRYQNTKYLLWENVICVYRPSAHKNCSTEACALHWRVGSWTQCTATCGRHGFQSRQVTCAHRRTGKLAREHHCTWRPRPASWQRCNILSCGRGELRTGQSVIRIQDRKPGYSHCPLCVHFHYISLFRICIIASIMNVRTKIISVSTSSVKDMQGGLHYCMYHHP